MIVAVYGAWYSERGGFSCRGTLEEFAVAGRQIGEVLAQLRKRVVITSFTPQTLDGYVAEGYLEWVEKNEELQRPGADPPLEIVKYNEKQVDGVDEASEEQFQELFNRHGDSITFTIARGRLRFGRHLAGLRVADLVITMGGADHTFMAGEVALLMGVPLAPIASFGGASLDLLEDALRGIDEPALRSDLGKLYGRWGKEVRKTLVGLVSTVTVAIVHGHDQAWQTVRSIVSKAATPQNRFQAVVMREEFRGSESMPVKWETVAAGADGAIAVLTPDDLGGLAIGKGSSPRARQNVWLEIGWMWGRLGRTKLMLLVQGDVEIPSDFGGIETYRYESSPSERSSEIGQFLLSLT